MLPLNPQFCKAIKNSTTPKQKQPGSANQITLTKKSRKQKMAHKTLYKKRFICKLRTQIYKKKNFKKSITKPGISWYLIEKRVFKGSRRRGKEGERKGHNRLNQNSESACYVVQMLCNTRQ